MMAGDLDGGRFDIRPLEDPPFYSEFILIQPARKTMMPAASLFAEILKTETVRARELFNKRGSVQRPRRA
jgi:LysR family nitrogen assimilation transcriptional regulator